jgi:tetratricopeptide (TPR) repeat protein
MRPRAWTWLLIGALALGAGLRIANLAATSSSPFFTRPVIDGQVYDEWAMAIKNGKAPAEPFYQDPLYPYFLAVIYSVFGHNYVAVYVIQLLLGIGLLWFIFDTTRMVFDRRAGIIAALLAALNKPLIFYEGQIEKTALAVFLVGLFVWMFVRALNSRRLVWQFLSGLALGLAALTRANLLIFAPLLPLLLLFLRQQAGGPRLVFAWNSRQIAPALWALAGIAIVIAPVAVRNTILAKEFTLTTTQSGQNLYIGNSEYNRTGQYVSPPWVRPNPEFEQTDFREYADKAAGRKLSYSQVSDFYTSATLKAITGSPGRALGLFARKLLLYFNDYEVPDNQDLYFFSRYSWVLRIPLIGFGIIFALGLAGILLLRQRPVPRGSLIVFFFGYALSVIAFYVFSRYRLPSLPALLPFAGGMVVWLWNSQGHKFKPQAQAASPRRATRGFGRLAGGLLLVAAAYAVTRYPLHRGSGKWEAAQCLVNLGSSYFHEGDTAKAVRAFNEALSENPDHGEALRNLGILEYGRNNLDQAAELLAHAVRAEPSNPVSHHFLGKVRERQGELDSAYVQYRQAVNLAPGRVEYRFSLAPIVQKLGDLGAALAQYDTMVTLAPDNPLVRHNRSVALYLLNRNQEAWQELEAVRKLGGTVNPQFEQALRAALSQSR